MSDRISPVEEFWRIRFRADTYPRLSKLFPDTVSLLVALGQFEQLLADGEAQDAELERLRAALVPFVTVGTFFEARPTKFAPEDLALASHSWQPDPRGGWIADGYVSLRVSDFFGAVEALK